MVTTVEQLAALIRGTVVGDGRVPILAAKPVQDAGPGDITFLDDERYLKQVKASPASALIVGPHFRSRMTRAEEAADRPVIEVPEPLAAFLVVRDHLSGATTTRWVGIHPQAWVAPSARIAEDVAIYPFSYVGEDAVIGAGCTIHPHAVVGRSCVLGSRVTLHPHVTLYEGVHLGDRVEVHSGTVLGADGFGYRPVDGKHEKVPQRGGVEIGDDVEIGANCTIDRGTFGPTVVGEGTKIDNLVMIGHNNRIGRHNLLCGQVGLAGSCRTGDSVVMGGQVGVKDHTEIGDRVMIGAQAGVHRNIPEGQQVLGSPAMPIKEQRQLFALVARLPMMARQLRGLVEDVTRLKGLMPSADGPGPDGEER